MRRTHGLNFIFTFVLPGIILYVGLVVVFFILNLAFSPGQIVIAYLPPGPINPALLEQMIQQLGLNDPLFFRFLRYLGDFLVGNWGPSSTINHGMPVFELLFEPVPRVFEVLILPLIVGINLGYLFGWVSKRSKRNWLKNIIQLLSSLFLAIPVFLFGMLLQYTLGYLNPIFPTIGFKNFAYPNPPLITGSRIFDSWLSGQYYLIADTLNHYALPSIILTIVITALMTRIFSSKMVKDSYKKKSLLSHTAKTSVVFGVILTNFILIDITFNLYSIGTRLVQAISFQDFFVLQGILFVILILFAIVLVISNLTFSLKEIITNRKKSKQEVKETIEDELRLGAKEDLKNYLKQLVKSPIAIIGLVTVLIPIILSIFPELISGYTFEQATGLYVGSWGPPSPEHLLGQTQFGRDVFARVLFGIRDALIFGGGNVLIGLIGGLIFGLLASKFTRVIPTIIKSVMLVFYVLPGIVLVMLFVLMIGPRIEIIVLVTGLLLIPGFTRIIANTEFRVVPMGKKIIAYAPLFAGFAILIYMSIGFLGFADPYAIQLGNEMSQARYHLYDAPWAALWPGFAIFLILISLFILHEGLAQHSR